MAQESNNSLVFVAAAAALLYLYFSNQSEDAIGATPTNPQAPTTPTNPVTPITPSDPVVTTQPVVNASDPVVPLPAKLVHVAGTGSQNVDEWNYWMKQIQNGVEQPDPLSFLPQGFDRSAPMSATDYVRYRGLGRATNARYTPQASRPIKQSTF